MKISKEAVKASKALFRSSFVDGKLDPAKIKKVVSKVAKTKPRHYIALLKNYQRLIRLEVEKTHAVIESARVMDKKSTESLEKTLHRTFGEGITSEINVVPELIGGLRIKLGSTVWDSSIRERLNRLETNLAQF